jgi:hypothetical protein
MKTATMRADNMREVIVKTTRMLAGRSIKVTQVGTTARCAFDRRTGKVISINLPVIPDNPTDEFLRALQGYLDHEVAHALFTDANKLSTAETKAAKDLGVPLAVVHNIVNLVEDARIEREMAKLYAGSEANLEGVRGYLVNSLWGPEIDKLGKIDMKNAEQVAAARTAAFVPYLRARAGQRACQQFMDDKGLDAVFADVDARLPDIAAGLKAMRSSLDASDLAVKIYNATMSAPPAPTPPPAAEPPEQPPEEEDKPTEQEQPPEDDAGEGSNKDKEPKEDNSGEGDEGEDETKPQDDAPETEDEDEGEGSSGKGDETPDEDGSEEQEDGEESEGDEAGSESPEGAEQDANDEGGEDESEEGSDADDGESGAEPGDDSEPGDQEGEGADSDGADGEPSDGEDPGEHGGEEASGQPGGEGLQISWEELKDTDEALAEGLKKLMKGAFNTSRQVHLSKDWDDTGPYKFEGVIDPTPISEEAHKISAVMQKDLQRLIVARSQSYFVPGFRSGRLNGPSLHRLKTGDDRVFKRRHIAETNKVAVSLVCDLSGSMSGTPLRTAMVSAYAFAEILDRLRIPAEVCGFTSKGFPPGFSYETIRDDLAAMMKDAGIPQGNIRMTPFWGPIFKAYDEKFSPQVKQRIAHMAIKQAGMAGNNDALAIEYAASRLRVRPEPRKLMIVFSDGQPSDGTDTAVLWNSTKQNIADLAKQGIEVLGVGVEDNSVKTFYPKHVVIQKVEELPVVTMKALKEMLLAS